MYPQKQVLFEGCDDLVFGNEMVIDTDVVDTYPLKEPKKKQFSRKRKRYINREVSDENCQIHDINQKVDLNKRRKTVISIDNNSLTSHPSHYLPIENELIQECDNGNFEKVKAMFNQPSHPYINVNCNICGHTPLERSLTRKNVQMIKFLISKGAQLPFNDIDFI